MSDDIVGEFEIRHSPTLKEFATAYVKAQKAMGVAKKGSDNPFFKSKYADLAEVVEAVKGPLNDNGIGYLQIPMPGSKGAKVFTMLLHESGEFIGGTVEVPATKPDAQGFGSAITYGRRYGLQSLCGVPAEDDDGNAASGKSGKDDHLSKEMTKAFPPDTDNHGLLLAITPATGGKTPKAMIQTPDGTLGLDIYGDETKFKSLIGKPVIYHYTKDGAKRPIRKLVGEDQLEPPKDEGVPEREAQDDLVDPLRGTVEAVKVIRKNGKEFAMLTISDRGGATMDASCWKSPRSCGVEKYEDLEAMEIFFTVRESEKNGKTYINIENLRRCDAV